ncbi:MAG: radical SAM protein [Candidatus Omnitrophica bacterium]|nr:radical SAM protein [Candidatus Omnitrophota bacterium]
MLKESFIRFNTSSLGQKLKSAFKQSRLLRPFYSVVAQRVADYAYPLTFNIEPTNACNLHCAICPRDKSSRKIGYIEWPLLQKIIDESLQFGPRHFILYKDGEPLLHPRIVDMVRAVKSAHSGNTVYISTNGMLLDDKMSRALIEAGLDQIQISLDAIDPDTYRKVRGGELERLEENVRTFIQNRGSRVKPVVTLQIIKMHETQREIERFIRTWKKFRVECIVSTFHSWGGVKDNVSLREAASGHRYPCGELWFAPAISWEGKVSICCVDWNEQEVLGDLKEQSFSRIWQGEKIRRYRQYHLTGEYQKIALCDKCTFWSERPNFWFSWQYKRSG